MPLAASRESFKSPGRERLGLYMKSTRTLAGCTKDDMNKSKVATVCCSFGQPLHPADMEPSLSTGRSVTEWYIYIYIHIYI